jgi:hypothetical protein
MTRGAIIMASRKPAPKSAPAKKPKPTASGLRAEPFVVELYVDDGDVKSTSVLHVPTNQSDRWEDWNDSRLNKFIRDKAKLADRTPVVPVNLTIRQAALRSSRLSSGESLALELDVHADGRAGVAAYQASVSARRSDDGARVMLAASTGLLSGSDGKVCIEVPRSASDKLRPGLYFVSAAVEPSYGGKGDQVQAGLLELV